MRSKKKIIHIERVMPGRTVEIKNMVSDAVVVAVLKLIDTANTPPAATIEKQFEIPSLEYKPDVRIKLINNEMYLYLTISEDDVASTDDLLEW